MREVQLLNLSAMDNNHPISFARHRTASALARIAAVGRALSEKAHEGPANSKASQAFIEPDPDSGSARLQQRNGG